jgi:hypothetical protein
LHGRVLFGILGVFLFREGIRVLRIVLIGIVFILIGLGLL